MKIFLDENFGITETDLEEVTQDSDGYNILKCYVPSDLVSTYDSFGVYYAAVLPSSRKVGYFALEGQASSDEENYTLYQASLHTSVVSIAGTVQLGLRFLYGDSGDASLKQKTTPVIQFPVRKSVSVNNDILVLDDDQTTTDVLESYKNLLETALATYVTIASLGASVTTATLNATNATITSGTVTTLDSDTATIDDLVVNNSVSMRRLSGTTVGSKSTTLGTNNTASATNAYAEGYQTQASGLNSHAEGNQTKATNSHSHAEGSGTKATGNSSHTEGAYTEANGGTSHAEGYYSVANNDSSHAEGTHTTSSGVGGHAEGYYTTASGNHSHAEGNNTTASGSDSHSEGYYSVAGGTNAHSEGSNTTASGNDSHAEGNSTQAVGNISHAEGQGTIANGVAQHVGGKYNVADTTSLEIIGNGTADNARSNARKLDANGNETLAGDLVYNGNTSLTSKMATKADLNNNNESENSILNLIASGNNKVFSYDNTNVSPTVKTNRIINSAGNDTIYNANGYNVLELDVNENEIYHIRGRANWGNCVYSIRNTSNAIVKKLVTPNSSTIVDIDTLLIMPKEASKLYVAVINDGFIYSATLKELDVISQMSDNLEYDKILIGVETYNKIIPGSGVITNAGDNSFCIKTYDVQEGKTYKIIGNSNWANRPYGFYDSSNTLISGGTPAPNSSTIVPFDDEVVAPSGAVKLIVGYRSKYLYGMVKTKSYGVAKEFSGLKWVCIGDSLTEVNNKTDKHYFDYVSDETGINIVNLGVSGTGYMRGYDNNNAFYQRVANIPLDADVITIFGSGNDLSLFSNLGTPSDTGTTTICGCINTTLDAILDRFLANDKLPIIGVITPTPWQNNEPNDPTNNFSVYCNNLIECCKRKSIPVLDLYRESNLHPNNSTFRTLAYSKDGGNGVHPDENGHKIIAPMFKSFLEKLIM